MENDVILLDCTLRDGGYVNEWNWGFQTAKNIIRSLVKANMNVVEVGFLRNVLEYNPNVSVCNTIEELNKLLPTDTKNTVFSAMAMRSNYDIKKLSKYDGTGIEMIRVTAHDYDLEDGLDFAREVKDKGYKLSINPINIMGYSDKRILWIIDQVNSIQPYQFSIVDTFGSMKRRDLDRIVSLVDHNLNQGIRLGLHLHENMALSCLLAERFLDKHLNRPISIDGSLMGIGRIPGNLPIELIADYANEYSANSYDIDYMMDAIQDYISPIKGCSKWGYTPAYFLSARYNLHRNYAEYYLNKGDLTHRDINHILSRFDNSKKTVFDKKYADLLYVDYKNTSIDDHVNWEQLSAELANQHILVLAPGKTINNYRIDIEHFIMDNNPIIISLNFIPNSLKSNYAFFSNAKRLDQADPLGTKIIITSNIKKVDADYIINYNSVASTFIEGNNSLIILLKLLKNAKVGKVSIAGADGYKDGELNYYDTVMNNNIENHGKVYNLSVQDAINKIGIHPCFITPSDYNV